MHYDGRFADQQLKYDAKHLHLTALIQAYLSTMSDIGIETWLMHGTLLGWYWNRLVLPWDSDIDVMVSENSMRFLAAYHNMTMYRWKGTAYQEIHHYLLEINPHCNESGYDKENKIDARWIDTNTGIFIDITTLRRNRTAATASDSENDSDNDSNNDSESDDSESDDSKDMMMVKDGHSYTFDDIFPLRDTVFENTSALVPYAYADILATEYGNQALSDVYYEKHYFDVKQSAWVPQKLAILSNGRDSSTRST